MTEGERETPIIFFNDRELDIRDIQGSLNEFFESQKIDQEQEQELREWFKREYKRLIERKSGTKGERIRPDASYHAAVLGSVLGELKAKVERVKVDKERGEARLNPFLETRSGIRKKFDLARDKMREAKDCKRHVVVLINMDLDDFKAVNDNFGHPAGDDVLKKVGKALEAGIRPMDSGAHYSGDEFGILMEMDFPGDMSMEDIRLKIRREILPRVVRAIQEPKDSDRKVIPVRPDGKRQELSVGFRVVEAKELGEFEDFSRDADVASEFSKILRIVEENAERKIESADRIVDFEGVMEMAKRYTQEERAIAKAIRDMKRTLGELERAVPGLQGVDTKVEALRFIERLLVRANINGGEGGLKSNGDKEEGV